MGFFFRQFLPCLVLLPLGITHAFFIQQPVTFFIKLPVFKEDKKQTIFLKTECQLTNKNSNTGLKNEAKWACHSTCCNRILKHHKEKKAFYWKEYVSAKPKLFCHIKISVTQFRYLSPELSLKKNFILLKNFIISHFNSNF